MGGAAGSAGSRLFRWVAIGLVGVLVVAGATVVVVVNRKPTRSAAAMCSTFEKQVDQLRIRYTSVAKGLQAHPGDLSTVFEGLSTTVGAFDDIAGLYGALEEVAPSEIRSDVATTHEILQKQADSLGDAVSNPLAALGAGLVDGFRVNGPMMRVNRYLQQHCDLSSLVPSS